MAERWVSRPFFIHNHNHALGRNHLQPISLGEETLSRSKMEEAGEESSSSYSLRSPRPYSGTEPDTLPRLDSASTLSEIEELTRKNTQMNAVCNDLLTDNS